MPRRINANYGGRGGVTITFVNNIPNGPSTDHPVTNQTASMIEQVVFRLGFTININSTTGGNHGANSRHYTGQGVDIDHINGRGVNFPAALNDVRRLQQALNNHSNIRENYGPAICTKTELNGTRRNRPNQFAGHRSHIHITGQN